MSDIQRLAEFFRQAGGTASFSLLHEHGFSPYALAAAGLLKSAHGPGRWDVRFGPAGELAALIQEQRRDYRSCGVIE